MSSNRSASLALASSGSALHLPLPAAWTPRLADTAPRRPAEPESAPAKGTRATPGVMRLRAVHRGGRVTDFMWVFVSASVARLMACNPLELRGRCMSEVPAGLLSHPALVARYRHVLEHGIVQSFEQVHVVEGHQDIVVHRVARLDEGVVVTLINLSADRRARSMWRAAQSQLPITSRPFK